MIFELSFSKLLQNEGQRSSYRDSFMVSELIFYAGPKDPAGHATKFTWLP